jgi:hypothetical protein
VTLRKAAVVAALPGPKIPTKRPVVLTPTAVAQLLQAVPNRQHRDGAVHAREPAAGPSGAQSAGGTARGANRRCTVMNRPTLEVAAVLRTHGQAYLEAFGETLSAAQRRALLDLALCRMAALGGPVEACDACGEQRIAYNSCRQRHCPKCQAGTRARWLEERQAELLPVDYVHVLFTLPHPRAPLVLQNQRTL